MSYNNGKVSAPVSIYDVQQALGVAYNDLKTLCMSDRVNMWSKIKPVEPNPGVNVVQQLVLPATGVLDSKTYRTLNGDWGCVVVDDQGNPRSGLIDISETGAAGNDSYMVVNAVGQNFTWQHRKPVSVGRLTDFAGYDHKAVPPLYTNNPTNVIKVYGNLNPISVYIPFFLSESQSSLRLEDFEDYPIGGISLGDMYLCAAYDGDEQGEVFSQQISSIIGGDSIDMNFQFDGSQSGNTWDIYFCLTDQNTWSGAKFWPMPTGNDAYNHIQVIAYLRDIFATMTLAKIGAVRGITSGGLSNFDLSDTTASYWSTAQQDPSVFDVYGAATPSRVIAPDGNGVVMKLTCVVGQTNIQNFSASLVALALNAGTNISAAVQIVGPNSNCATHPSTSTQTFTLQANATYTFYVVALDTVADAINEIQLSMNAAGHVDEGMTARTPWMNVNVS